MTFREIYKKNSAQRPIAPGQAFVREIAALTMKSESTVRAWISGRRPEPLVMRLLCDYFDAEEEELFPLEEKENNRNKFRREEI